MVFEKGERRIWSVGMCKAIRNEWKGIKSRSCFTIGNERRVEFWKDLWCNDLPLKNVFLNLFYIASNKDGWVVKAWGQVGEAGG